MRIVADITELYEPYRTGLYVARLGLVSAMLRESGTDHEITLLSSRPAWPDAVSAPPLPMPYGEIVHRPALIELPLLPYRKYYPRFSFLKRLPFCAVGAVGRLLSIPIQAHQKLSIEQELERRGYNVFLAGERTVFHARGAKHFGFMHDLTPIQMPENHTGFTQRIFAKKLKYIERHCEFLLACSETTRQATIRELRWSPERIWTVAEGWDEPLGPRDRAVSRRVVVDGMGLPDRPLVLCVSALEPRKNHARLLDAFRLVRARMREEDPLLVLVGPEGWQAGELKGRIAQETTLGNTVWTNYVSRAKLAHLYRAAQVAVFVPLFEGFGLPVLEAMACGTPVITSAVSSMPEVAGDAAVLVNPESVEEMAGAMESLLRHSNRRAELSAKGLQRASAITWSHAGRRTLDIFRYVCGEGECPPHQDPVLAPLQG